MTSDQINDIAGTVIMLAAIPAVATALIYGLGSPWWNSWLGRVMFMKWLSVALVFLVIIARRTWGDYPGYEWVALVVYTFTLITFSATAVQLVIERRSPDDGSASSVQKEKYMTINPNAVSALPVPDIWYKAQRVLRTIVQFLVVAVPLANIGAASIIDYLQKQEDVTIPGWVFIWLNAILVGSALIMGGVARIMAIPGVNEWLTKLGLGSVPEKALIPATLPSGKEVVVVAPDPKAETVEESTTGPFPVG
jgi:hypothetical protein